MYYFWSPHALILTLYFVDAEVFLQEFEVQVFEGSNISVCVEIELPGELLADIEVTFALAGGGPGAGECVCMVLVHIFEVTISLAG